jgi:hypothetical protein
VDAGSTPAASTILKGEKMSFDDFKVLDLNPKNEKNYEIIKVPDDIVKECYKTAKIRRELHKNHASQRVYSEESEFIGILGEYGFGIKKGKAPDLSTRIGGDDYDFRFEEAYIDVKATQRRNGVPIRPEAFYEKPNFIYVMVRCSEENKTVSLIGWIKGTEINDGIKDTRYNEGDIFVPEDHFKDMKYLDGIINKININPNKQNYYKV